MSQPPRILYCHCAHAQVVPDDVKKAVLRKLCDSGAAFDAVADLCEMAARRDPALLRLAAGGAVKIAACAPRWHVACQPALYTFADTASLRSFGRMRSNEPRQRSNAWLHNPQSRESGARESPFDRHLRESPRRIRQLLAAADAKPVVPAVPPAASASEAPTPRLERPFSSAAPAASTASAATKRPLPFLTKCSKPQIQ